MGAMAAQDNAIDGAGRRSGQPRGLSQPHRIQCVDIVDADQRACSDRIVSNAGISAVPSGVLIPLRDMPEQVAHRMLQICGSCRLAARPGHRPVAGLAMDRRCSGGEDRSSGSDAAAVKPSATDGNWWRSCTRSNASDGPGEHQRHATSTATTRARRISVVTATSNSAKPSSDSAIATSRRISGICEVREAWPY